MAVFDLAASRFKAVETVDVTGLDQPICAVACSQSAQHPGWIAVGNVDTVAVYRLSSRLAGGTRSLASNTAHLTRLLQSHAEGGSVL